MGNRISKVYTRTVDDGTTGMADGSRVKKSSVVIAAIGEVDELNAVIGVLRAEDLPPAYDATLLKIQNDLFTIGGELSMPAYQVVTGQHITIMEQQIDQWNEDLVPLKEFILPAGNRVVALCHQARTVCRRAERSLVTLNETGEIRIELIQYLNRLSDYLFVAARSLAHKEGISEVYWTKD